MQYARSFLHSEQDDGDLTYFVLYQLGIIQRAISDPQEYLSRKVAETQQLRKALKAMSRQFNYRQLALLEHAVRNPGAVYTVTSHSMSPNVVPQTPRTDLHALEQQGVLIRTTSARSHAWSAASDLPRHLGVD
jgi:Fic family protein